MEIKKWIATYIFEVIVAWTVTVQGQIELLVVEKWLSWLLSSVLVMRLEAGSSLSVTPDGAKNFKPAESPRNVHRLKIIILSIGSPS